ncbi:MAG TPA: polysaccharide deacetylase family protein [Fastidiosipila sp.]|nr:polysaccharide deacetylase family protein [Fastidiosipila sp.]
MSWWYRRPAPGERATIDAGIQSLISSYGAVWQLAPSGQKRVYLTMDAGYEFENNTTEILDIAAAKGVPITFFITGSYLNNNFGLVQRMINEGHQVGNHTQRHLRASAALETSTQTFINDLLELEMNYLSLTGRPMPKLYRPAEGGYSERSLKIAKDFAYTTVFWSFAYRDWLTDDQPDPDAAFDLIMSELHDGSILLLHAVSDTNVAILPRLIDAIRAEGYTFVLLQPQS